VLIGEMLAPRGTLIDVGANVALMTIPVANDGHQVLAVEMLPEELF
jgi:hypothetical protein